MTGLNLESFLHLLRADLGAWVTLGLIAVVLALMAWTSWGSRRALRKCLVLSVVAHVGLALYGGTMPVVLLSLKADRDDDATPDHIRQIKVLTPAAADGTEPGVSPDQGGGRRGGGLDRWDRTTGGLALADTKLAASRTAPPPEVPVRPGDRTGRMKPDAATAEAATPAPPRPESRPEPDAPARDTSPPPPRVTEAAGDDVAPPVVAAARPEAGPVPVATALPDNRLNPSRPAPAAASVSRPPATASASIPETLAPALAPSVAESAPPPVVAARDVPTTPGAGEPAPPAAAEVAARDVAPAEVTPARPDAPRISAGEANLRTRSRPGTGTGVTAGVRPSAPRPPIELAMRPAPALGGSLRAPSEEPPAALAERAASPDRGDPLAGAAGPGRAAVPGDGEPDVPAAEVVKRPVAALPTIAPPESDVRRRSRPRSAAPAPASPPRHSVPPSGVALSRVTPGGVPALPEIQGTTGGRPLADVPEVYRSRLDPNRSASAFRAGASPASEQAVERALDWLARHQDADGRWDGGTAKNDDGTAAKTDDDFTVHCPPGETCFGECIYWEADTALTGLALLSYLGAGYTQADGKYAETVGKGLDFLLASQKPDGDLRGRSRAVGMYCHAMATIALCEAYALTGDERLRPAVERAVDFIVNARARDGLAWRYTPGEPVGDTSILGWVVMALKSAREVGISVPPGVQAGTLGWLRKVSTGADHGLARYQPAEKVTPTMTAEAWVCRQFLGAGGPGAASTEAADYLLAHGPKSDGYNLYYWYYGTLAMYQHGGDAWSRWNAQVRDEVVGRQRVQGHSAGSWDPDDSPYGARGGRIYCTALATLSLEVYYRYLRLYDEPKLPHAVAPPRPRAGDRDPSIGRLGAVREPARPRTPAGPKR